MQIKSRQRVVDHGEVFTNEREVKAMVDLVWDKFAGEKQITATYLEPACGSGNFLVEILNRKLEAVISRYEKSESEFEIYLVKAVCSVYGVDLLQDNVEECRTRLFQKIKHAIPERFKQKDTYNRLLSTIKYILRTNIICGNALTYRDLSNQPIVFTNWSVDVYGWVTQNEFNFLDISAKKGGTQSLFKDYVLPTSPAQKHYLKLGT